MNIDILFSARGEAGLVANQNFASKLAGVVLDKATGEMTLEYADSDYLALNIPLELARCSMFERVFHMHIGSVKNGQIGQAYQVPVMIQDDPYRGDVLAEIPASEYPLSEFQAFIKKAISGQPMHRDDVGDEGGVGCILGDAVPSALQFAPHLAQRQTLEAAPKMQPSGPAPSAPGMGMGGGGSGGFTGGSGKDGKR